MVMVNLGSIELALIYLLHKTALRWPKLGSGSENIMQMGRYVLKIGNKGIYIYNWYRLSINETGTYIRKKYILYPHLHCAMNF